MPDTTTLLPCPFCGEPANLVEGHREHWRAQCSKCDAKVGGVFANRGRHEDQRLATEAWNTRIASSTPSKDVEERARELFEIARPCFHYAPRGTPDGGGFERSEQGRLLMKAMLKIAATPTSIGEGLERQVIERLTKALEPFAAMGRVMEARATMTFGKSPPDSEVVCQSSGEVGMGILTMGHFRDAVALLPKAPGWGGMYRQPFDREHLSSPPSEGNNQ